MTLFDRCIAVDWSAANERRTGIDSIWIAERGPEGDRVHYVSICSPNWMVNS